MAEQGYEIDFLPVGNGDRSGDAICIRFGEPGNYKVLVYDGGTQKSGKLLVEHITTHYGTTRVDYVVNSHPDQDHASGLGVILEEMEVGELWMHRPWLYSSVIRDYFNDGRMTDSSLAERMKTKMAAAHRLEELAIERNIPIKEPFQGVDIGPFRVLSPSKNWYVHTLLPDFAKTPDKKKVSNESFGLLTLFQQASDSVLSWVDEHWHIETLKEDVSTSAENESSVILYGSFGESLQKDGVLLTGDSGIGGLAAAADYVESLGHILSNIVDFWQIPHHGSRNNVSTSVLDRVVGPRRIDEEMTKMAFVSAAANSSTHPRKVVINAFTRRGVEVHSTQGKSKRHSRRMPARLGWVPSNKLQFSHKVEPWD